jgi:hypothetical protein
MRNVALAVIALCLGTASCTKDPQDPVENASPSAAAGAAPAPQTAPQQVQAPSAFGILFAQIGTTLGDNGLLAESASTMDAGSPVHGLAVFQGPDGTPGKVEMQLFGTTETILHREEKSFTVQGPTSIGFVVPPEKVAAKGRYRALFLCNGGPCWEVPFEIR